MTTKLTLSVEKEVIEKAKIYAKQTGRSLSELVETYLENIIEEQQLPGKRSTALRNLVGSVHLPKQFDESREKESYLKKKYL